MNGHKTATATWVTQYQVTFNVSPAESGSTIPSANTLWLDSGQLQISLVTNAGYTFSNWRSDTSAITFSDSYSATTFANIAGPGTITASLTTINGNANTTPTQTSNPTSTQTQITSQTTITPTQTPTPTPPPTPSPSPIPAPTNSPTSSASSPSPQPDLPPTNSNPAIIAVFVVAAAVGVGVILIFKRK